ncbi:MAG: ABC transporter substrate-binding protein [Pararhodobacter sp.]|nr:ABC transporter substrate-binding protein [Pararhodobacter sp.]
MPRPAGRSTLALPRASRLAALAVALGCATAAAAEPPRRVVSLNLCTDQLAMMLAAPGQLISVTHLAADPMISVMADQASALALNHARAEEIHALNPDLVLAVSWTPRHTVSMLRRLDLDVVEMPLAMRLEEIPANIAQIGHWLGREAQADALIADFHAGLAAIAPPVGDRPRAVLHNANNYTSGSNTMAGQILALAGLANIAEEAGISGGGSLPMEQIVMLAPDLVIQAQRYPGASRAEGVMDHPAMAALRNRGGGTLADAEWVCGTPHVLRAVARLTALRHPSTGSE